MEVSPAIVAARVLRCLVLGATVGVLSDLLLPLRRRLAVVRDLVLSVWLCRCWLVICFSLCHGDIRLGYWAAACLGALLWRVGLSPLIRGFLVQSEGKMKKQCAPILSRSKKISQNMNFFRKNTFQRKKNRLQ